MKTLLSLVATLFFVLSPAIFPFSGDGYAFAGLHVLAEPTGMAVQKKDGKLTGWGVEIVREIMRRAECGAEIELMPWARAYDAALARPDVILFPATRTRERDELFHWVGPIFRVRWSFLARKDSGIVLHSLDDARKVKSIGTYLGDARDRYLTALGFTNLERTANDETNYRKLEYGRVDLIVGSDTGVAAMADSAGIDPANFVEVLPLKEVDIYVALSARTAPRTVAAWQEAFRTMRDDGTFARILARWHPEVKPPMDERLPWRDESK